MALNDLYEVSLKARFYEQECMNIFQYHQALEFVTTNPTQAQALAEAFVDQVLPSIAAFCAGEVTFVEVFASNLYDPDDRYTLPISVPGEGSSAASDSLTSFDAYAFALTTDSGTVKQGAKRFPGVPETAQTDGVITSTAVLDLLTDCADVLAQPILIGTLIMDPVFIPVIVKRVRSGVPGNYSYRMPTNSGEGVFSAIVVTLFKILVTSQVSRKIGVGI